jgi:adenosyl cobinamide kinase/adenosyl cobinamide phosphate guanylyltransferase
VIVLVLGGARSGKSEAAERIAMRLPQPVTYVATAQPDDDDFRARIEVHRARRPAEWSTIECGSELAGALRDAPGTALVDSLGTWVTARGDVTSADHDFADLVAALAGRQGDTVVVTEEVGLGVHPSTESGRRFRDALGTLNVQVGGVADRVLLVVAGRVLELEKVDALDALDALTARDV